jgi:hypothetical protein
VAASVGVSPIDRFPLPASLESNYPLMLDTVTAETVSVAAAAGRT